LINGRIEVKVKELSSDHEPATPLQWKVGTYKPKNPKQKKGFLRCPVKSALTPNIINGLFKMERGRVAKAGRVPGTGLQPISREQEPVQEPENMQDIEPTIAGGLSGTRSRGSKRTREEEEKEEEEEQPARKRRRMVIEEEDEDDECEEEDGEFEEDDEEFEEDEDDEQDEEDEDEDDS
jgi:hypothetical protein